MLTAMLLASLLAAEPVNAPLRGSRCPRRWGPSGPQDAAEFGRAAHRRPGPARHRRGGEPQGAADDARAGRGRPGLALRGAVRRGRCRLAQRRGAGCEAHPRRQRFYRSATSSGRRAGRAGSTTSRGSAWRSSRAVERGALLPRRGACCRPRGSPRRTSLGDDFGDRAAVCRAVFEGSGRGGRHVRQRRPGRQAGRLRGDAGRRRKGQGAQGAGHQSTPSRTPWSRCGRSVALRPGRTPCARRSLALRVRRRMGKGEDLAIAYLTTLDAS